MIKKIISLNLLLIYALALIKPFVPVINYLINEKYIAAKLCVNKDKPMMHCNGKCYMAKQLKKTAEQTKKNFPINNNSTNYDSIFCIEKTNLISSFLPKFYTELIYFYSENKSAKAISKIFHPPSYLA